MFSHSAPLVLLPVLTVVGLRSRMLMIPKDPIHFDILKPVTNVVSARLRNKVREKIAKATAIQLARGFEDFILKEI